ncbi:pilus assembly protein PilP [Aliikangiella coralliicola]|uniref:Pilus assembly protein PilP n=1 Tax=Aliikangiella coralliicola TaxID=2592383 RepID=A0A545UHL4_9GAMM|nr:pilus assembly protein PilP [Aliikangiella coralliicola]TQV88949.1 pilus assembly protein PilP [Aliikangiella coralliicola]
MKSVFRFEFASINKKLAIIIGALTLSACSGNTDDLRSWVETIKARPPGRIEPMPEVREYKPHDYASAHLKSPFSELEPELETQLQALHDGCDESVRPDTTRRKEDLERYSLDSMEMVGLVNNNERSWGLVRMTAGPAEGNVFHVSVGNYLGINHGRILNIDEQQIEITTLVPDSKGCWEKRTVYMALAQ